MARRFSGSVVRGAGALVAVALIGYASSLPVQAASVSAAGALSVAISGPDSVTLGVAAPISVVVTNTTAAAEPGTLSFVSSIGSKASGINAPGALCTNLGGNSGALFFCQLASLAPGASTTVSFNVTTTQLGTVDVGAATSDGVNFVTSTDLVLPVFPAPTDVQVTGFASTGSPTHGSVYTYTFQVKDDGPWPAPAVTFADSLPAQLTLVGVTSTTGSCSQAAGTISCAFGDMAVGSQANVVVSVQAPATAQTITDTASVAEAVTDRQPSNNTVGVTVQTK